MEVGAFWVSNDAIPRHPGSAAFPEAAPLRGREGNSVSSKKRAF